MERAERVEKLLMSGGDSRTQLESRHGFTKYGCRFRPRLRTLALGSCTASSPSARSFQAALEGYERLQPDRPGSQAAVADHFADVRQRLKSAFVRDDLHSVVDVVLAPSGTDVEFMPLALVLGIEPGVQVTNIVVAPGEVGGGSAMAARGELFDARTPAGLREKREPICPELHRLVRRVDIKVRRDCGATRSAAAIDAEVEEAVTAAIADGRHVLLHRVAHSKTGISAPSLPKVRELKARHSERLHVVVDAAQGRLCRGGVSGALRRGSMMFVTGSKFYGGPPFSAALFVPRALRPTKPFQPEFGLFWSRELFPEEWRPVVQRLPPRLDRGLALRWEAALAEIETYWSLPAATRRRVVIAFDEHIRSILGSLKQVELCGVSPKACCSDSDRHLLQGHPTVFPFQVRTGGRTWEKAELQGLHTHLNELQSGAFHLGQPVALGGGGEFALRVALGAPLINDIAMRSDLGGSLDQRVAWLGDSLLELRGHMERYISAHGEAE